MGISADRSSALSTAFNLFTILSLPIPQSELDNELSTVNRHMHNLVPKLFARYDRTIPPYPRDGGPVEVTSYLMVDHIEQLDEFHQTLTFHGTLVLSWLDDRLAWEPGDFGQLDKLSFTGFDLTRFWSPGVTVKGVTMPSRQLAMFHNTLYTLMSSGHVFGEVSVSVRAACRLDLTNYPNDNQTCFVMVFSPIYPTAKVTFKQSSSMLTRGSLFSGNNMTMASGFRLRELSAKRFFAFARGFTDNETEVEMHSSLTNTILRYQIALVRSAGAIRLYSISVTLPLFCTTVMAIAAVSFSSARMSLLWLFSCIFLYQLDNSRMASALPPDFDSEPPCVRLSRLLLLQCFSLLLYRLWIIFQLNKVRKEVANGEQSASSAEGIFPHLSLGALARIHSLVQCILLAEMVFLFAWLFF